ncbi:GNAT family N-acetyltransferase [Halomonas sp. MA07-2]|uniref:GNAT family N-acetyltransferase n=1 Tax=unclassified Halomonas TaxID=2609666 RepID=UPI003EEF6892
MMAHELAAILREEHLRPYGDFFHGVDLETYADKLLRNAELLVHYRGSEVLSLAAFYCNDAETLCGFLSLMWVSPEERGSGIACVLLDEIISVMEVRRFHYLKLEVLADNHRAINFYRRQGFEVIDNKNGALIMGMVLPRRRPPFRMPNCELG